MTEVLTSDEIDKLLTAINASDTQPEDFRPARSGRKIKIYDFKRPDKFSREQIRNISIIHENFARLATNSISAKCRAMSHVHVASVDQLTYEEFLRCTPVPTTLSVINMAPLRGNAVMEIDPAITLAMLDGILGGYGDIPRTQHELTDIETSLMEGVIQKLIADLRESWRTVLDLQPKLKTIETSPQFVQIVPPTEMILLITLETKIVGIEGMMNICIPFLTVEPVLGKLSDSYGWHTKKSGADKINADNFENINKVIRAEYFKKEISMEKLSALLKSKGIIINDGQTPYSGKLYMDNVCIAEFNGRVTENGSKKICISKKECKSEKNYMSAKNNVLEESGTLKDINVQIIAELGRTVKNLGQVSELAEGTILELDKMAGDPVDIYANNVKVAVGEVVVIDESFGVRITDVVKE